MQSFRNNRWLARSASARLTALLLAAVFLEILRGIATGLRDGSWEAWRTVHAGWLGGMPLLGVLLAVNLALGFLAGEDGWRLRDAGKIVARAGVVAALLAALAALAATTTSSIELRGGERVSEGGLPGSWELRLDGPRGAEALSLSGVSEGEALDFGEAGSALVAGYAGNGVVGADMLPIALPAVGGREERVPAVALDFRPAGGIPTRVALDGKRPVVQVGRDAFLSLRPRPHRLPFGVELVGFRREAGADSSGATALLRVSDGFGERRAALRRDRPLRIGDFALHLEDVRPGRDGAGSTASLRVVESPLQALPFPFAALAALGVVAHLALRPRASRAALAALLAAFAASEASAGAARLPDVPPSFAAIPIRSDGRAKGLGTFADQTLAQIAGTPAPSGIDARRWLAAVLFAPEAARDLPVFLVRDPALRDALGLEGEGERFPASALEAAEPTLSGLASAAERKPAGSRDALDREALLLRDSWSRHRDLVDALVFLRPASLAPAPPATAPAGRFLDLALRSDELAELYADLVARCRSGVATESDSATVGWMRETFRRADSWERASLPVLASRSPGEPWRSPAATISRDGLSDPATSGDLLRWDALRTAWLRGDREGAESAARALRDSAVARAGSSLRPPALRAEAFTERTRPVRWAGLFLWIAAALAGVGMARGAARPVRVAGWFLGASALLLGAALLVRAAVLHALPARGARDLLLWGALAACAAPWAARRPGARRMSISVGASAGAFLVALATGFSHDGAAIPGLAAAAWSTFLHACASTALGAGFAATIVAGISAHGRLLALRAGRDAGDGAVRIPLLAGMAATSAGVLLQAAWNQAYAGSLWSWTPSECAPLLVVFWSAFLLQARSSGLAGPRRLAAGAILSVPIALPAWTAAVSEIRDLDPGVAGVAGLSVYAASEAVFIAVVLFASRARLALRGLRLWRIRYVRSRNPRLRRHGDTGGWGEGPQIER